MTRFSLTIGGKPVTQDKTFDVLNPADGTVVAACPEASIGLVDQAVASARRAFPGWAGLEDAERVSTLLAMADVIERNHAELSELITREQGKTQSGPGANFEVAGAVAWTRVTAGLSLPKETIQDDENGTITIVHKPIGVVGSITPWNWPLLIAVWHIIPALRVGCTVVIKPSPFTPLSTLKLVELMNPLLPAGVLNVVTGGPEIGAHIVEHPGIDKIVFTGSIATGKAIMASASRSLKRVTLELGGNDAGIVLPGTDVSPLLEKMFWGAFLNAGQTCAAMKRLYVHESQYDEVVAALADHVAGITVGNGIDPESLIGPVSNKMQLDKVIAYVEEARARGARIVTGGHRVEGPGFFYPLTVIADVTDDMQVVKEEQFGPVLPIIKYKTIEEAIERANSLDVGLGGSVWSNDATAAATWAARLECGTAWVNQHGAVHPLAPFGGIKCSGIGVEFNVAGLKEYTSVQVVNIAR